jgi:acetyl-CoA carboxylase carboxyl transferase subunit alpha
VTAQNILETVEAAFTELKRLKPDELVTDRYEKFRKIGAYQESKAAALSS